MGIAYGMFQQKDGKLYPLFVDTDKEAPIGVWQEAEAGPCIIGKNGRKYTRSKLGMLAYRPGKHLAMVPLFDHIGKRTDHGLVRKPGTVICEVEYNSVIDYGLQAKNRGTNRRDQCLDYVPRGGFYFYKTNPKAKVAWIIAGEYKIKRVLSEGEVAMICRMKGFEPQEVA